MEMELLEHVRTTLVENNLVINKKTPAGLSSFRIVDDSLDSQNKVNNLTENNQDDYIECEISSLDSKFQLQQLQHFKKSLTFYKMR